MNMFENPHIEQEKPKKEISKARDDIKNFQLENERRFISRKNRDFITKDFLNEIRQKRITEVKNFKSRHRDLLKRLSGIADKKKIPKLKTLKGGYDDLKESR